jgi:hypothetical protein
LDEVKAELKVIRGTYGGMQTWADDDIARHKVLKARKLELMAMLGRAV